MYSWSTGARRRPNGPAPSQTQLLSVARDAVSTLKLAGVEGCFVGGMACSLFGTVRKPNDLDILCLTSTWEQEALKRRLVALNSCFYLVPSRDPCATYKVLWYHISETNSCIKVDLLLPGVLDIPNVPLSELDRSNSSGLPCAPLSLILLLKLQAWVHHGESALLRFKQKQPTDAQDINELLVIARGQLVLPRTEPYLPQTFVVRAESRVEKYVESYPASKEGWKALGFTLPEKKPVTQLKQGPRVKHSKQLPHFHISRPTRTVSRAIA